MPKRRGVLSGVAVVCAVACAAGLGLAVFGCGAGTDVATPVAVVVAPTATPTITPTPAPTSTPVPDCALGFVPFRKIVAILGPDRNGDRLVTGEMTLATFEQLRRLPLPRFVNERFCGGANLGDGYQGPAYVPTARERQGDFSMTILLLTDPLTGHPYPSNIIPANHLPTSMAWRIPPRATQ